MKEHDAARHSYPVDRVQTQVLAAKAQVGILITANANAYFLGHLAGCALLLLRRLFVPNFRCSILRHLIFDLGSFDQFRVPPDMLVNLTI